MFYQKIVAILLALALLATGVSAVGTPKEPSKEISPEAYDAVTQDVWQTINAIEDSAIPTKRAKTATVSAYYALVDEVAEAVETSDTYVSGSINRNGYFLSWQTEQGIACCYSPRLRARVRAAGTYSEPTTEVQTTSYATRSSGPDAKDVALFEPYIGLDSSFTKQYQRECASIAETTGGTYRLYTTTAATIDAIADELERSAVVAFDSHGDTDYDGGNKDYTSRANTSYFLLQTGAGLTTEDQKTVKGPYGNYSHALYGGSYGQMKYYLVDGTAITNHMEKSAPNTLVWMAICLGMATDGLAAPLRIHGAGVVYGYSQSVTFDGDYDYEQTFWENMKQGATVAEAISDMKGKHGSWDPGMGCRTISQARREKAAFPIVVSDNDVYPGHGNVDDLQNVYSDWTLYGSSDSYTITAVSSNPAYGTVTLDGRVIKAVPQTGYEATGYEVSPEGACTVTQNGNVFAVSRPNADCTVTITFTPRQPATVTYQVPEGLTCHAYSGYVGDTLVLPSPQGTLLANKYKYSFIGWSEKEVENALLKPAYLEAGKTVTLEEDIRYYALFSYRKGTTRTYYTTSPQSECAHEWVDGQTLTPPTCTEEGTRMLICKLCGVTMTQSVSALGHKYENGLCIRCDAPDPTVDPCTGYSDIDCTKWYHEAVDFVIKEQLMGSTKEDALTFEPNTKVSRAMVAAILYRMGVAEGETVEYSGQFADVPNNQWYTVAVEWCEEKGIAAGSNGKFRPNDAVSRQELAVFIMSYAYFRGLDISGRADLNKFPDGDKVPTWAADELAWAVDFGIISGQTVGEETLLNPGAGATRAELASILMRFLQRNIEN